MSIIKCSINRLSDANQVTTHVSLRPWLCGTNWSFPGGWQQESSHWHMPFFCSASIWRPEAEVPRGAHDLGWNWFQEIASLGKWLLDVVGRWTSLVCLLPSLSHPFPFLPAAVLMYFKFCLRPTEAKRVRSMFSPNSLLRLAVLIRALYYGVRETRNGLAYIPIFLYELYRFKWLFHKVMQKFWRGLSHTSATA